MGTTQECVANLAETYSVDQIKAPVAELCKVEPETAREWLLGRRLPVGEALLRLRIFLQLAGYRVSELDDLPKSVRTVAQMIALDVITLDEATKQLDYTQPQEVFRVVLRNSSMMGQRQRLLLKLAEEGQPELEKKLAMWQAHLEEVLPNTAGPRRVVPAEVTEAAPTSAAKVINTDCVADAVDGLVAALSALLDNGTQPGHSAPMPVKAPLRVAILDRVQEPRLRRLIAQLEMLQ